MNKTIKKLTIAVVALSLILLGVVGGVAAWLVAQSSEVTNTFTVGQISIELTETSSDTDKTEDNGGYKFTHVLPGDKLNKVATVTVNEGSEKCYVYVLITNNLNGYAEYNMNTSWVKIGEKDNAILYRYTEAPVNALTAKVDCPVFTTLTFEETIVAADKTTLDGKTVVLKAYAHQADNTNVDTADDAAKIWAGITPQNNG